MDSIELYVNAPIQPMLNASGVLAHTPETLSPDQDFLLNPPLSNGSVTITE